MATNCLFKLQKQFKTGQISKNSNKISLQTRTIQWSIQELVPVTGNKIFLQIKTIQQSIIQGILQFGNSFKNF